MNQNLDLVVTKMWPTLLVILLLVLNLVQTISLTNEFRRLNHYVDQFEVVEQKVGTDPNDPLGILE